MIGLGVAHRARRPRHQAGGRQPQAQGLGNTQGDLVLHREDVRHLAVVALGPDVITVGDVDELDGHAQALARLAHAALKHLVDPQPLADPAGGLHAPAAQARDRQARDLQALEPHQGVGQLVGHPFTEVLLVRVRGEVHEGQHGDCVPVPRRRRRRGGRRTGRSGCRRSLGGRHRRRGAGTALDRMREVFEAGTQLAAEPGPRRPVLAQAAPHQLLDRRRHLALRRHRGGLLGENGDHRLDRRGAGEGPAAGEHLVDHGAEGEEIRAVIHLLALDLLRRHVADRAHDRPRHRRAAGERAVLASRGLLGEAEVQDLHPPVVRQEEVGRLEVAVHDPLVVGGGETRGQLPRGVQALAQRQRAALQPLLQSLALQQLGDHVGHAVLGADVEHREDVGMVEGAGRARLVLEAAKLRLVGQAVPRQDLDGDLAAQPRIARPVHLSHAAGAEQFQDLVGSQARARLEAGLPPVRAGRASQGGSGRRRRRRRGAEGLVLAVGKKERLDLVPQVGIGAASMLEELRHFSWRPLQGRREDTAHLSPSVRVHGWRARQCQGRAGPAAAAVRRAAQCFVYLS